MIAVPAGRVVVVGGGLVGLTLACELALAGVPCRVFERRPRPVDSGVVGLAPSTLDLLNLRGLANPFISVGKRTSRIRLVPGGVIDLGGTDGRFPFLTVLCRGAAEKILAARAAELGVEVICGAEVVGLSQDDSGVTVALSAPTRQWRECAAYVVGCDGAESAVRTYAGISFPGSAYDLTAIQADVRLGRPPADELMLQAGPDGVLLSIAYGAGRHRLTCVDVRTPRRAAPPTLDELRAVLSRITGYDLDPQVPRRLERHHVQQRLVDSYRTGRVLLAGDAAHLHSPIGGQAVHLGVGDAVNLGWKLAAVLHGWAPPGLLETYTAERRPVARAVIDAADRLTRLLTATGPDGPCDQLSAGGVISPGQAMSQLIGFTPATPGARLSPVNAGDDGCPIGQPGGGPLTGQLVPEAELVGLDGRLFRIHELLREGGRFVLLDVSPDARCATAARGWPERVRAVVADPAVADALDGALAVLIRPDGYVAWSTAVPEPAARARLCRDALTSWCGAGRTTRLGARRERLVGRRVRADT